MRVLFYVTNNGFDTVLRVDSGRVVSVWMVTPKILRDFLATSYVGDWEVHDPDGIDGLVEGERASVSDYGEALCGFAEDHPIRFSNNASKDRFLRRCEFLGVEVSL